MNLNWLVFTDRINRWCVWPHIARNAGTLSRQLWHFNGAMCSLHCGRHDLDFDVLFTTPFAKLTVMCFKLQSNWKKLCVQRKYEFSMQFRNYTANTVHCIVIKKPLSNPLYERDTLHFFGKFIAVLSFKAQFIVYAMKLIWF